MNVSVVDLSANQKKLQVEISAPKVQKELEKKYRDLARQVRIKGFRPGKVPLNILKSYYGKTVENEVSSRFIEETFLEALREADLKPLVEADVDERHFEDNGAFTYVAVVEVCPPFEVEGYRGLEIRKPPVRIKEEQEQAELERIRQQHAQLRTLESERPVQEADNVLIDFVPWLGETAFEKGRTSDYMLEVGKKALHLDFDRHLIGHRPGDVFSVELDYPEDTPTREIAGKRVRFEVTVKEIKEKILPELNDDFAQELGQYDTLEALKQEIRDRLRKQAEEGMTAEMRKQITDQLLEKVRFDVSPKVIEREIDQQVGFLKHQFESQGLKIDGSKFNTPEIRNEYRAQAERNVRSRLIAQQIAKQENIELVDEDMEEIYRQVARMARMDVEQVEREYAQSPIVEQAKEGRIQDKVFEFLEREAVYEEISEDDRSSDQE